MTYYITSPGHGHDQSFEDKEAAIKQCKWMRGVYAGTDYCVVDSKDEKVFPLKVVSEKIMSVGSVLWRYEIYDDDE